jgi:hypothetical protein
LVDRPDLLHVLPLFLSWARRIALEHDDTFLVRRLPL